MIPVLLPNKDQFGLSKGQAGCMLSSEACGVEAVSLDARFELELCANCPGYGKCKKFSAHSLEHAIKSTLCESVRFSHNKNSRIMSHTWEQIYCIECITLYIYTLIYTCVCVCIHMTMSPEILLGFNLTINLNSKPKKKHREHSHQG